MSGTAVFSENFENGSNGANLTTSNTNFTSFQGTGSATFDNSVAALGAQSVKLVSTGSNFINVIFDITPNQSVIYARSAIYLTSYTTGTNLFAMSGVNAGNNASFLINTTGTISLRNGATLVAGPSTNTVPLNTWFLVEWKIDNGASTQTGRFYNSLTGSPVETISGTYNQGVLSGFQIGVSTAVSVTYWQDLTSVAYDDWLGPLQISPAAWLTA